MAGDKKNNSISARPDDAPTSELEALTDSMILRESEAELEAHTFPFDEDESGDDDAATLRARLKRERERVEQLLFDKEHLRAKLTGAQKEIAAREELGSILQKDLKDLHKKLEARDRDLRRNQREIESLEAKLDKSQDSGNSLAPEVVIAESDVPVLSDTIGPIEISVDPPGTPSETPVPAPLQMELQDLKLYIDGRKSEWEFLRTRLAEQEAEVESSRLALNELQQEAGQLRDALRSVESDRDQLRTDLKATRQDLKSEASARRRAESAVSNFERGERRDKERVIAEQAGQLASARQETAVLAQRVKQAELHADELRGLVNDLREQMHPAQEQADVLRAAIEKEQNRSEELESRLAEAARQIVELESTSKEQRDRFDLEIRRLRFELDTAQDTIVSHETINEQLASDLIDNKTYRQALEEQLSAAEENHSDRIKKLERRVRTLEQELEDRDRKIDNKDGAISALLAELSGRAGTSGAHEELEVAIGEIDEQVAASETDRSTADKERTSRVLIGNIDGQELRFPLFKNRLTVGRTANNDIQLGAQYISRRHAVLFTDDRGTRIVDWGSKNGVFVNGVRVSEQILRNGDTVRIGTAEFAFEERSKR